MDQNKQDKLRAGQYPLQGAPPSYEQSGAGYPTQQGGFPSHQGGYMAQGAQGAYPNTTAGHPIARMEKNSVMTVCSGCNNQVMTSVNGALNNNGIAWIIYSVCCGGLLYLMFLLIIDAFKTFTHKCPICGKIFTQFTPKVSDGERAGLVFAICFHVVVFVIIFGVYAASILEVTSRRRG